MRSITSCGLGKSGARISGFPNRWAWREGANRSSAAGAMNPMAGMARISGKGKLTHHTIRPWLTADYRKVGKRSTSDYCDDPGATLPRWNFTIRDMISVHAYQRSRGLEIVYS